ncbi:MAG: AAA family ATPase [Halobacteriota archaeon]
MDAPLWTETHAPTLAELPQPEVRERLALAIDEPMNLVVQGPPGVGKTAAVRALARESHGDPDDLVELNVADFFGRTKKEIRNDPRFESFLRGQTEFSKQYRRGTNKPKKYKRNWSKRDMVSHILQEFASYPPASGGFNTIVLDNAEAIREDFQQALRRIMERYYRTTQFVFTTRQPSKLIPPIRSRCFPIPVRAPSTDETVTVLERIVTAEGIEYDADGLEYVAGYAGGDLRRAILSAQTTAVDAGELTMNAAYEVLGSVGNDDDLRAVLAAARDGDISDARKGIDDLLDEGYDGQELLGELLRVARAEYADDEVVRLYRLAGGVDEDLATGLDDRIHLTHLLTAWVTGEVRA